jgi:hypothetical protein
MPSGSGRSGAAWLWARWGRWVLQIPGLLSNPRLDRVLGGAEDPDAARAMLDHGQDIHLRAVEEVGGKEVKRQDPLCLRSQELGPARPIPARSRVDPGALEDLPHRRRCHRDAEPGKLAVGSRRPSTTPAAATT